MLILTDALDRVHNQRMNTEQTRQQEQYITVFFDTNGSVSAISRSAIYALGYSEDELLGLHALNLFYQASDLFRFVLHFDHHEVISNQSLPLRHKDGSVVNCIITAIRPMSNISGETQDAQQKNSHKIPQSINALLNFLTHEHWETEKQYFNSLAVYLSNELNVEHVFIGYFKDGLSETVEPITLYTSDLSQASDNQLLEYANFQNIISNDAYCFVGGIQDFFPQNTRLMELHAESFAGITLRNASGQAIGVLGLVSRQQFHNINLIKTLLQIASLRTSSELQNYLKKQFNSHQLPELDTQELRQANNDAVHELRDLISTLNTSIYMLKKKPQDIERGLKALENQLGQVSILVQRLNAGSSKQGTIDGGQARKIDLNKIAAKVIKLQSDLIHKKRVRLEFLPETNPACILVNEAQIERIIAKLLSNAIHHTLPQSYILIEIKALSSQILFRVFDTGIGIDSSDMPDVFKHFYRSKSGQDSDSLSRLDMSMVKDFVYQHSGQVEIDSDPEQGTDVRVYFPLYNEPQSD